VPHPGGVCKGVVTALRRRPPSVAVEPPRPARYKRAVRSDPLSRANPVDLFRLLTDLGIESRTAEHQAVFTVEQSREIKNDLPGGHSKNLFVKDKKGRLFLIVAQADTRIDLKRVHEAIGASGRVSFGSADLLREVLGVEPGSVTPFAVMNDRARRVAVVLDARLMANDLVNFHPLVNTATTTVSREDLVAFLSATGHEPRIIALPEPSPADCVGGEAIPS
jgi:Ala-tRNA(Pro) deacylase